MCGIYGMVALSGALRWPERADALARAVRDRGPDAHGRHTAPDALIGVHRLRVVDPSPEADQPFVTTANVVALNGEIYNAPSLRRLYPDHRWRSRTDGEVLLPLLERGDPGALRAVAGMYAVAHWTPVTRTLVLARDRFGEKPLFYARLGAEVWFASSPDALHHHPQHARSVDLDAAREFLHFGVIRPPRTMTMGIRSVPPGCAAVLRADRTTVVHLHQPSVEDAPHQALASAFEAAMDRQMTADVPVGVFLSGGIDSSLVAEAAARRRPGLPAFTVGFPDASYDERPRAARVAHDLGLPLATVEAGPASLLAAREKALALAEPIADPALLPTILLAERARQDVTVVLSGEGADELFGGYPTYLAHRLAGAPVVHRSAAAVARLLGSRRADRRMPLSWLLRRFGDEAGRPFLERHVAWFAGALPSEALPTGCTVHGARCASTDPVAHAMALDQTIWLPNRLLTKLDRATMRVGLEARAPFLDPAIVTAAGSAAAHAHVGLRGKRRLRALARQRLPSYVWRQAKRGLSVPVGTLLRQELRPEAERALHPERVRRHGLVREAPLAAMLDEHQRGAADHGRALWTLLTLEAWCERAGLDLGAGG